MELDRSGRHQIRTAHWVWILVPRRGKNHFCTYLPCASARGNNLIRPRTSLRQQFPTSPSYGSTTPTAPESRPKQPNRRILRACGAVTRQSNSSDNMASLTPTWRAGASHPIRRAITRPLIIPTPRHYASMAGRNKIIREMDRASRQSSNKMAKEQSMSNMQKLANAEYFKDGGGPLFPGSSNTKQHHKLQTP